MLGRAGTNEAKANPWLGGDPARRRRVVAELLPQLPDQHAQVVGVVLMVLAP